MDGAPAYGHIVVGVDGSPTSRAALRWAAREAEMRNCPLDVVYGWQVKGEPRPPGEWGGVAPPIEAYQQQAQARIQAVVDEVLPNGVKCEMTRPRDAQAGRAGAAELLCRGRPARGRLQGARPAGRLAGRFDLRRGVEERELHGGRGRPRPGRVRAARPGRRVRAEEGVR